MSPPWRDGAADEMMMPGMKLLCSPCRARRRGNPNRAGNRCFRCGSTGHAYRRMFMNAGKTKLEKISVLRLQAWNDDSDFPGRASMSMGHVDARPEELGPRLRRPGRKPKPFLSAAPRPSKPGAERVSWSRRRSRTSAPLRRFHRLREQGGGVGDDQGDDLADAGRGMR